MAIGFTLPFAQSTGSLGFLESTRDEVSAVKQNLRSLLVTNWSDRVMHSTMGCNLVEFLFEQRTEELKSRIADRVQTQVARWMPFVSVSSILVVFSDGGNDLPENSIGISIDFKLRSRPDFSSRFEFVSTPPA